MWMILVKSFQNPNFLLPQVTMSMFNDISIKPMTVGPEEFATVASIWSGIPVQQITAVERMLLVDLEEQLKRRVIGQNEAVFAISRAMKRSYVGLKDPNRSIVAMIFCGPTGVGKTELTKALAACYFGSENAMLRLDMSEYMERHTASKLIGSPPDYVGYEEGRKPIQIYSTSFYDCLKTATSQIHRVEMRWWRGSFGFLLEDNESASFAGLKVLVMEELKAYFCAELLNRIDEMLEMVNLMLQEVKASLMSLGIGLRCLIQSRTSFVNKVTALIEDLSEALLAGEDKPGETVFLSMWMLQETPLFQINQIMSDAASIF
ncbi:hypothetical protein GQ457_12G006650 [Hibiscus cannabinus]